MSRHDRATAALLTQLMMAADGALFGVSIAYVAYRSIRKYAATSSALRKVRDSPAVQLSDLRSVLYDDSPKLVIVRGSVEVFAAEKGNWKSLMENHPVACKDSDDKYVILQRTQTCIYNEWRGIFGWTSDLYKLLSVSLKEPETSTTTMNITHHMLPPHLEHIAMFYKDLECGLDRLVISTRYIKELTAYYVLLLPSSVLSFEIAFLLVPFILVDAKKWPHSDYVVVNMEGSNHPLPLTTAYQHLQPISSTPYTFLQALCGLDYPIGMLYEEKILPLRTDITAVGICYPKNGTFEIKSCKDLPYFLTALTKDQIVADLSFKTKVLMWSGLILGTVALGILGYSVGRNWTRWKDYRRWRRTQQQNNSSSTASDISADVVADEEPEEIPDGELCVICQTRRRRSAFVPCGHRVCCPRCALSVERDVSPKCPICRQTISSSVRIYDS